jgi:hypothetical protein
VVAGSAFSFMAADTSFSDEIFMRTRPYHP